MVRVTPIKPPDMHEVKGKIQQWIDEPIWQKLYRSAHIWK